MSNTSLTPELAKLTSELAHGFTQSQKVVSAHARIRLFFQSPDATALYRKAEDFGEELRNKQMAGMAPSDEEIAKFNELRQSVVDNDVCRGYLEARMELDELLSTVNQYLCMAINNGTVPTDEEVAETLQQQMSSCSCGGGCSGNCDDCDSDCDHKHDGEHECCCGGHGHEDGHECCGGHGHGEGHECRCGKH